jgi:histidine triad (HIT) family protein
MTEDCLICREHRLEVPLPGGHLVSTDEVVAFHLPPWQPPSGDIYLGYLMLTSRRHTAGFAELTDRESAALGRWIARLSKALKDVGAERVYLAVVGHEVPHLHISLVPRWPGTPDEISWLKVDEWSGARRGDFAAATVMADEIRHALASAQ